MKREELFGMKIVNGGSEELIKEIVEYAEQGEEFRTVFTLNSDHLTRLEGPDSSFKREYSSSYWITADGMPIVLASKLLGKPLQGRLTGADLLPALLKAAEAEGLTVGVVGANDELLGAFNAYCLVQYPALRLSTYISAPMNFDPVGEDAKAIAEIFQSYPTDILLSAVSFPKQEKFLLTYGATTGAKVGIAIGAAIEFLVERKVRAPLWMQNSGLEFVHRWASEPRRLTQRYLSNFAIVTLIAKEMLKRS